MPHQEDRDRVHVVKRLFDELGFGNAELLEGWDGGDLAELSDLLNDTEFEQLQSALEHEDRLALEQSSRTGQSRTS